MENVSTVNTKSSFCTFCKRNAVRYTCPRCNVGYCSVGCYKDPQHADCSEGFYHDWVVTHLKHSKNSEGKAKMLEILNRRKEELDSDDDDDIPGLDERLAGVNLDDDALVWEKLTEEEKSDFRSLIDKDEIRHLLPEWNPWWHFKEQVSLVEVVDEPNVYHGRESLPPILPNIPHLNELLRVTPSSLLKFSIINCLYGYVYLVKFYNGDHRKYPLDFIMNLLKCSKCLESKGQTWNDVDTAVTSVMQEIQQDKELSNTTTFLVEVINELRQLVEGSSTKNSTDHVLRALTDIKNQTDMAKTCLKTRDSSTKDAKAKLGSIEKKMLFYLSWTQDYGATEFQPTVDELNLIYGKA